MRSRRVISQISAFVSCAKCATMSSRSTRRTRSACSGSRLRRTCGLPRLRISFVLCPFGVAEAVDERGPVPFHLRHHREVAVLDRVDAPDAAAEPRPVALRDRIAEVDRLRDAVPPDGDVHRHERADVDELPAPDAVAVVQREQHRERGLHPGVLHVGGVKRRGQRLALRVADAVGDARAAVGKQRRTLPFGVGPAVAERRDGRHDEPRVRGPQPRVVEAQRACLPRPEGVQQHVGVGEQRLEGGASAPGRQVEARPVLAAVEVDELAAVLRVRLVGREGAVLPQRVALERFDLDDRGAEAAQQSARVGDGLAPAGLDNAQAGDGARHTRLPNSRPIASVGRALRTRRCSRTSGRPRSSTRRA